MKQAKYVTMLKRRNPYCTLPVIHKLRYYSINFLIRVTYDITEYEIDKRLVPRAERLNGYRKMPKSNEKVTQYNKRYSTSYWDVDQLEGFHEFTELLGSLFFHCFCGMHVDLLCYLIVFVSQPLHDLWETYPCLGK